MMNCGSGSFLCTIDLKKFKEKTMVAEEGPQHCLQMKQY